jgi:HSP20 family protein
MLSLRFSPMEHFQEMNRFQQRLGRMLEERFAAGRPAMHPGAFPALDVWEDEGHYFVEAELPGLELENLEIYVADQNVLTIKGERKPPVQEDGTWHRRERGFGSFERSLALPAAIDADHVEATLKQGVLAIKLPKAPESRPRKVVVNG